VTPMDVEERSEIVELDPDSWITLDFSREWPKYVVEWSIRRRRGDGDFPLATGRIDHMPPRGDETLEEVQEALRSAALDAARSDPAAASPPPKRPSLLKRLLNRS
jgi:hypothetical protein